MSKYFEKYGIRPKLIEEKPDPQLGICVVIPCYNEPDLEFSLESLYKCNAPTCSVEVIVVLNAGEQSDSDVMAQNRETEREFRKWTSEHSHAWISFHLIKENRLPKKHAGVGLARKIGMDEAVRRFTLCESKDGIIVCYDADSTCDQNYLTAIEKHFNKYPKTPGCSIRYEHPVAGSKFTAKVYDGIIKYELFLRYYNQGLKDAGLPYAFHTVGSCMAVRSSAYQKQGGMNKRKAGEDFYFIHKIIQLGGFTELNETRVIPSPRESDRVPFGTGKAITDWIMTGREEYMTYDHRTFMDIRKFVLSIPNFRCEFVFENIPKSFQSFYEKRKFTNKILEIRKNSSSDTTFLKRFLRFFDAFQVLKFVHFCRDHFYPNTTLEQAVRSQIAFKKIGPNTLDNALEMLWIYRKLEEGADC